MKEIKAGAAEEFTKNKYRITYRMYNRVIEPKVLVKVKLKLRRNTPAFG